HDHRDETVPFAEIDHVGHPFMCTIGCGGRQIRVRAGGRGRRPRCGRRRVSRKARPDGGARRMKLAELAERLRCELRGDGAIEIRAVRSLEEAGPGDVAFLANRRYASQAATTKASAIIVPADAGDLPCATLRTAN